RELAQLDDGGAPLSGGAPLPVAAVGGSHRPDARSQNVSLAGLLCLARASAASEQRDTADQREDGAGVGAMQPFYGFDGVVNHGQVAVSNSMSARQLSSSGSWSGPI